MKTSFNIRPSYPSYLQHPFPFLAVDELTELTASERVHYQESLKVYRDLKNVIDTAFDDGVKKAKIESNMQGKIEGELSAKIKAIIKALKHSKLAIEEIAEYNDTTTEFVLQIKNEHQL